MECFLRTVCCVTFKDDDDIKSEYIYNSKRVKNHDKNIDNCVEKDDSKIK